MYLRKRNPHFIFVSFFFVFFNFFFPITINSSFFIYIFLYLSLHIFWLWICFLLFIYFLFPSFCKSQRFYFLPTLWNIFFLCMMYIFRMYIADNTKRHQTPRAHYKLYIVYVRNESFFFYIRYLQSPTISILLK